MTLIKLKNIFNLIKEGGRRAYVFYNKNQHNYFNTFPGGFSGDPHPSDLSVRKKNPWLGLILPLLTLLWSVARLFTVRYFEMTALEMAGAYLSRFLGENIPTYVLLALYFACRIRNRRKKQKMLDKMNLHDLH